MSDYDNGFARAQRAYDAQENPDYSRKMTATETMEEEFGITVEKFTTFWRIKRNGVIIEEEDLTTEEAELFEEVKKERRK